jgi:hypothetical protein
VKWADPVAASALLPLILREAWEAMKGNHVVRRWRKVVITALDRLQWGDLTAFFHCSNSGLLGPMPLFQPMVAASRLVCAFLEQEAVR